MNYTETGYPCASCGEEYIKTYDGVGGCLNSNCDLQHPSFEVLKYADAYDESEATENKVEVAPKKEDSNAGRKKVSANKKKKARQVFYSEDEFAVIIECAEFLCIEPKIFMEMGIKKLIKHTKNEMQNQE